MGRGHDLGPEALRDLASRATPAGALRAGTGNQPLRSPRYRRFVQPQGYDDEMRVAFRSGESTWAVAALYREKRRPPFSTDEVALMAAVSGIVGAAFRTRVAMATVAPTLSTAPGLLMFDGSIVLVSANAEATRWLADIYGHGAEWRGMARRAG